MLVAVKVRDVMRLARTSIGRGRRFGMPVTLLVLTLLSTGAATTRILPVRTSARFKAQFPEEHWFVPIKASDGRTAYVLSLEPDFDVGHHVLTVELVLRRAGSKVDAPNLLRGKWHGLQDYDFAAGDLAHGVKNSAFGEKRTVSLKNLGLVLRIVVTDATVSPISATTYQLDTLGLQVEVDNL